MTFSVNDQPNLNANFVLCSLTCYRAGHRSIITYFIKLYKLWDASLGVYINAWIHLTTLCVCVNRRNSLKCSLGGHNLPIHQKISNGFLLYMQWAYLLMTHHPLSYKHSHPPPHYNSVVVGMNIFCDWICKDISTLKSTKSQFVIENCIAM